MSAANSGIAAGGGGGLNISFRGRNVHQVINNLSFAIHQVFALSILISCDIMIQAVAVFLLKAFVCGEQQM